MYFAIISEDVEESLPRRLTARPAHLERLRALQAEGRLLLAGPFPEPPHDNGREPGFTGSLVVADFPDLASCRAWADADPYVAAGVYARVVVKPFKKVLP